MTMAAGAVGRSLVPGDPGRRSKRYPVPVSVTLRNLYVISKKSTPSEIADLPPAALPGAVGASASPSFAPTGVAGISAPQSARRSPGCFGVEALLGYRAKLQIVKGRPDTLPSLPGHVSSARSIGDTSDRLDVEPSAPPSSATHDHEEKNAVYSSLHGSLSLHPHWDHLDERVGLFDGKYDKNSHSRHDDEEAEKWDEVYKTLKIRLVAEPIDGADVEGESATTTLAEVPLHPTLLRRLPRDDAAKSGANGGSALAAPGALPPNAVLIRHSDGLTRVAPYLYHLLLGRGVISEKDPSTDVNVMEDLIEEKKRERRFEDDVFAVLDNAGTKQAPERSPSSLLMDPEPGGTLTTKKPVTGQVLGGKTSAFDDDGLFDLLGGGPAHRNGREINQGTGKRVAPITFGQNRMSPQGNGRGRETKESNLFDLLDGGGSGQIGSKVEGAAADWGTTASAPPNLGLSQLTENQIKGRSFYDILGDGNSTKNSSVRSWTGAKAPGSGACVKEIKPEKDNNLAGQKKGRMETTPEKPRELKMPNSVFVQTEVRLDALRAEFQGLQKLLAEEELGLEQDEVFLGSELAELESTIEDAKYIRGCAESAHKDANHEMEKLARTEFMLEARQMKLLRDLRDIYPIRSLPNKVYTIRDIHLPSDVHSLSASDGLISTALGFVCHLVFMCSKYLSIPLRYRLVCNSSRSAVQDDGHGVLPLFKERVVEKEDLDRAIVLLERNIECLLLTKGFAFNPQSHILAKLDFLFVKLTEVQ